jgi:hypothetical protein
MGEDSDPYTFELMLPILVLFFGFILVAFLFVYLNGFGFDVALPSFIFLFILNIIFINKVMLCTIIVS